MAEDGDARDDRDHAERAEHAPRRRRSPAEPRQRYLLPAGRSPGREQPAQPAQHPEFRIDDSDPRRTRVIELIIAGLFLLAAAAGVGFMIAYVTIDVGSLAEVTWSTRWLGTCMTVALLATGIGVVLWVRGLMPQAEVTQEREPLPSAEEDRQEAYGYIMAGARAARLPRRPLLRRTLLTAAVPLVVAPVFLLRGLAGKMPFRQMYHTVWRRGMRLIVYGTGEPIRPVDFATPGSLLTVVPEGYEHDLNVLADATVQIIKFRPGELKPPTRLDWVVEGIVAYSKICTHVGCATGLYEDTVQQILCPCHQSTFDAAHGCRVIFGPASRPLPQLPLEVDEEGYLVAAGDFPVPVGPSFWGRG